MTLDDIRARFPRLGFAVYALDPDEPITLEVHANGETFTWTGADVAGLLVQAFPTSAGEAGATVSPVTEARVSAATVAPAGSVFD